MENHLDAPGVFHECLARYMDYMGLSGPESGLLKVQFLSKGEKNELDEVMGLVQGRSGTEAAGKDDFPR